MYNNIHKAFTNDIPATLLAASAIFSPTWLPSLDAISDEATKLLPILGVVLVCVQIFVYLKYHKQGD